jgi:hypothetical protein
MEFAELTKMGVVAAVGCGLGLKAVVLSGGVSVAVNAATIGMCLFMIIDALGS